MLQNIRWRNIGLAYSLLLFKQIIIKYASEKHCLLKNISKSVQTTLAAKARLAGGELLVAGQTLNKGKSLTNSCQNRKTTF
jgi:hypothetical protein